VGLLLYDALLVKKLLNERFFIDFYLLLV